MTTLPKITVKRKTADTNTATTEITQAAETATHVVQPAAIAAIAAVADSSPATAPQPAVTQAAPTPAQPVEAPLSDSKATKQTAAADSAPANQAVHSADLPTAREHSPENTSETQEVTEHALAVIEPKPVKQWFAPTDEWQALFEAVVGLAHRDANPPLPCQDTALADSKLRPIVIVADGAGSSAVSEIGSQAVVSGLSRLLNTLAQQVSDLLDKPDVTAKQARSFALLLVKHALGILEDLAVRHRRPLKDFRCTLLLAIHGQHHTLWVKIGDGALVAEHMQLEDEQLKPRLFTLGEVGKGEFANLTTFIDEHLQPEDVQTGLHPSLLVTGLAAMSDGAADRLVSNDGGRVADQVASWLHLLRQGKLKRRTLTRAFYADSFTKGTTGDDCSIALAACTLGEAG